MAITNINRQNFCPLIENIWGAAATAATSDLSTLTGYIPEGSGMDCEDRLSIAYFNINDCPEAKRLLDKVRAIGKIFWECIPTHRAPTGAKHYLFKQTIGFSYDKVDPNPGVSCFLFELKNAEQAPSFLDLIAKAAKGLIDKYEFVYEVESSESLSVEGHDEIAAACQKSSGWPSEIVMNGPNPPLLYSEQEIEQWMKTSKIAVYVKPSDTLIKITQLMYSEFSGHSQQYEDLFDLHQIDPEVTLAMVSAYPNLPVFN